MSQIYIKNLTYKYDNQSENIFENVTLKLDSDWKLGLIGRNGRGKTTLLKILAGQLDSKYAVESKVNFGYFPIEVKDKSLKTMTIVKEAIAPFHEWEKLMDMYLSCEDKILEYSSILEKYIYNDGYIIEEMIKKEVALIGLSLETLDQPFKTLSGGEQTKILLVAMFLRKNHFLLIDEPTNHLDLEGRKIVAQYLKNKQGFILVSHDRVFVDEAVDHILSINKTFIEIQKGNYSSWRLNKDRQDEFELLQNERLKKDISRLEKTAREKADWANKIEASKFGSKVPDRGYIGHKSAKMMKRAKNIERRQNNAIDEKVKLLKNIERAESISFNNINGIKNNLLYVKDLEITYDTTKIFKPISFEINKGECLWLKGLNGCGKSSIIKLLMGEDINYSGEFKIAKKVSYVCQDSSFLKGSLNDYIDKENIDGDKLRSNLYKIGVDRNSFDKNIENWSEGQKKKLLIAKSLCEQAELYIWDEPLNYIDIIARKQIENLIVLERPTMLIIEHDRGFMDKIATKVIDVEKINSKG